MHEAEKEKLRVEVRKALGATVRPSIRHSEEEIEAIWIVCNLVEQAFELDMKHELISIVCKDDGAIAEVLREDLRQKVRMVFQATLKQDCVLSPEERCAALYLCVRMDDFGGLELKDELNEMARSGAEHGQCTEKDASLP